MLTPNRYWRVAKTLTELEGEPAQSFELPAALTRQNAPPAEGDGVLLADYDPVTQTGSVRYVGIIRAKTLQRVEIDWMPVIVEIWVDTPAGRGNWAQKVGFKFADTKVAGYGLHQLFVEAFPGLHARAKLPNEAKTVTARAPSQRRSQISRERLDPIEVIGEPTSSPRGGYVYLLRSAYGYKVGRTRNMPNRMRSFGIKLPFIYTIPLCAWFEDHIEAEASYHRMFSDKHLNGEWFDLGEEDVALVRARQYSL